MLDGMFSFVLLDTRDNSYIAARDPIGITPLYLGYGRDGSVWIASEMKVRFFLCVILVVCATILCVCLMLMINERVVALPMVCCCFVGFSL